MKESILEEFKLKRTLLDDFKDRITNLLIDLLRQNNITIHQISCRIKELESLDKKIDRKQGKYNSLQEITDIVGIRIITYLESEVDVVANLLSNEFKVDVPNSTDKRILKSDQFGYKSLHVVCSLDDNRCLLTEYKSYRNIKCEIQIRSILQHAWAEIEHDLGYKSKSAIPDEYIRDFNRLAALLETADKEFDRLKGELSRYEKEIYKLIKEEPQNVELNQASLISLGSTNEIFNEAKEIIVKNTGAIIYENIDVSGMISRFKLFKIATIKELEDELIKNKKMYLSYVNEFTIELTYDKLPSDLPIFYFQHFLASKTENPKFVEEYFNYEPPNIGGTSETANKFVEIYKRAVEAAR